MILPESRVLLVPSRRSALTRAVLCLSVSVFTVATGLAVSANASAPDTTRIVDQVFPTHSQFVHDGLRIVAESLFTDLIFSRPKPILITPEEGQEPNPWFEDAVTTVLFDRGFIVRDAVSVDSPESQLWELRYRVDRLRLLMPEATRRSFLGRIWVKRHLDAAVRASAWNLESGELLWSETQEHALTDWVPKRNLTILEDVNSPLLSPEPPLTITEKLIEPVAIITAVGALTVLFFAVR